MWLVVLVSRWEPVLAAAGADCTFVHRSAKSTNIVDSAFRDLWYSPNSIPFLTLAVSVRLKANADSASISDSASGGTHARSVMIVGLNSTFHEVEELLLTAGLNTASAYTTTAFIRLNRVYVAEVGTYGNTNAALITVETTGLVEVAHIEAGIGESRMSVYTVPSGYTGYLRRFRAAVENTATKADVRLWKREDIDQVSSLRQPTVVLYAFDKLAGFSEEVDFGYGVAVGPKTDLWVTARTQAGGGTTPVTASYELVLSPSAGITPEATPVKHVADAVDAFGSVRVSANAHTMFAATHTMSSTGGDQFNTILTGAGASKTWNHTHSFVALAVTNGATERVVHHAAVRTPYQPGRGLRVRLTGIMNPGGSNSAAGAETRMGYFDLADGAYFSYMQNGYSARIMHNSVVTETYPQAQWNVDRCDGTTPSGCTLNPQRTHIYEIDFAWLGVGSVRFFATTDVGRVLLHEAKHANYGIAPYMRHASLYAAWSVASNSGGAAAVHAICAAVTSDGGYEEIGRRFYVDTGADAWIAVTSAVTKPLIAIRLRANTATQKFRKATVSLKSVGSIVNTNSASAMWFVYRFRFLPDVNIGTVLTGLGTWTTPSNAESAAETAVGSGITFTAGQPAATGELVASGLISRDERIAIPEMRDAQQMTIRTTMNANEDSDLLVFAIRSVPSGAIDVAGSMEWEERV